MNIAEYGKCDDRIVFVPMGGVGEIGMNCALYGFNDKWIMVDCGAGFASEVPGVHLIIPNFSLFESIKKKLIAVVITHIHEDHIGAIPYLCKSINVPIYASKLGINFLREKFIEHKSISRLDIRSLDPGDNLDLGPFNIKTINLTHSTPEMMGLIIETSAGRIFHTGDWKIDDQPIEGNKMDYEKLKAIGNDDKPLAMICDSTNIFNEGHSGSEGDTIKGIRKVMSESTGLTVFTIFSSNIARMNTIARCASEYGKKVMLAGGSIIKMARVARESGYLKSIAPFISSDSISQYHRNELVVIASSCQCESRGTMNKLASDSHRFVQLIKGDTVAFSSKMIPGNEVRICSVINRLLDRGINVITNKDIQLHSSGHFYKEELRQMYSMVKPDIVIPVHGEIMHIEEHNKIAREEGINVVVNVRNGYVTEIKGKTASHLGNVVFYPLAIDGKQLIAINDPIIKQRKKLAESGVVFISLTIDSKFKLVNTPNIILLGCMHEDEKTMNKIEQIINRSAKSGSDYIAKNNDKKKSKRKDHIDSVCDVMEHEINTRLNEYFDREIGKKVMIRTTFSII